MATNCTSEDLRPQRRPGNEALAWAAAALRSERLFGSLRRESVADETTKTD
jgi:hypothetical protein